MRPAILTLTLIPLAFAAPVLAQDAPAADGNERVNQLIVYGDDPCPASADPNEITVCARKDEGERYRIPENLRESSSPQNNAWTNKVLAYETVTRRGIMSCSPVGAGGELGCTQKLIKDAYDEKRNSSDVRFSELIAQERARRLSTIDAEAAETQSRVEEIEKQMEERRAKEQEAAEPPPAAAGNRKVSDLAKPPQGG